MQAVVTGATGFIGTRLCAALRTAGYSVTTITRDAAKAQKALGPAITCYSWSDITAWEKVVASAEVVFHLAGENLADKRWTPEFKKRILSSRVDTTRAIVQARPKLLLSASGTGYYGDCGNTVITEEAPAGDDFLAQVCIAWEEEAQRAEAFGGRVIRFRTATTLGNGGALEAILKPPMLPFSPWKMGLGGPMGTGDQWMPWIHVDDLVRLYLWVAEQADLSGPLNATAPKPVTNRDFSHALGHALDRPSLIPIPAFALYAILGGFADALLFSQRVIPTVANTRGFTFGYPEIGPALLQIIRSEENRSGAGDTTKH